MTNTQKNYLYQYGPSDYIEWYKREAKWNGYNTNDSNYIERRVIDKAHTRKSRF